MDTREPKRGGSRVWLLRTDPNLGATAAIFRQPSQMALDLSGDFEWHAHAWVEVAGDFVSASFVPHCDVAVVDVAGAQSKWLALWTFPWYFEWRPGEGNENSHGLSSFFFLLFALFASRSSLPARPQ